jgi:hypothetical protein
MTEASVRNDIEPRKNSNLAVEAMRGDQSAYPASLTRWWSKFRGKSSKQDLTAPLETTQVLSGKVPKPHHLQLGKTWLPPPPPPMPMDWRLLTAASYMWERFSEEEDPEKRMAHAHSCIDLHNLLSAETAEFREDFLGNRKDSTKKALLVLRSFLAIGQLVHIRSSKGGDFDGILLRISYDINELRLEAYGENKEFDEKFHVDFDDLRIEAIGDWKTPQQIFDPKNAHFSDSIIEVSGKMENNNNDVKTVVDAFPGGKVEGKET